MRIKELIKLLSEFDDDDDDSVVVCDDDQKIYLIDGANLSFVDEVGAVVIFIKQREGS